MTDKTTVNQLLSGKDVNRKIQIINDRKNAAQKFAFYVYLTLLEQLSRYQLSPTSKIEQDRQHAPESARSNKLGAVRAREVSFNNDRHNPTNEVPPVKENQQARDFQR
jgi:hypothetical protein